MGQDGRTCGKEDSKDDIVAIIILPNVVSNALNKAKVKAAVKTKEAQEGDAPHVQMMTVPQLCNIKEEEEEEEELCMPGSFDFGDQGAGATMGEMPGTGMSAHLWTFGGGCR